MAAILMADLEHPTAVRVEALGDTPVREMTADSHLPKLPSRIVRLHPHLNGDSSVAMSWELGRNEVAFYRDVVSAMPSRSVLRCIKTHVGLEPRNGHR